MQGLQSLTPHRHRGRQTCAAETEQPESKPLFTPEFASVLQGALERQGDDALLSGSAPAEAEEER